MRIVFADIIHNRRFAVKCAAAEKRGHATYKQQTGTINPFGSDARNLSAHALNRPATGIGLTFRHQ